MEHERWARLARSLYGSDQGGYDVWIVVTSSGPRDYRGPGRQRIYVTETRRRGNLIGTLEAWRSALDAHPELEPAWAAGELRVAMLHDAGLASRTGPLVAAAGGSRGAMAVGGLLDGEPLDLARAVMLQASPLAASQVPGELDVFWCSQLFLPSLDPDAVRPSPFALTKLVMGVAPELNADALRDLGVCALDHTGAIEEFAPQGSFATAEDLRAWGRGRHLAVDLGSFRIKQSLLHILERAYAEVQGKRDLDPHLVGPLSRRLAGHLEGVPAEVAELELPPQPLGATDLGADLLWQRYRRPQEVREAAVALVGSRAWQALHGIERPLTRVSVGGRSLPSPSFDQVARGVEVEGLWVQGVVAIDAELAPGSRVEHSLVERAQGLVHARGSRLYDVEAEALEARDALVYNLHQAGRVQVHGEHRSSPYVASVDEIVAVLEERTPAGSDYRHLVHWLRTGALRVDTGEGLRPVDGGYVVGVSEVERSHAVRCAARLVEACARHWLAPPRDLSRDDFASTQRSALLASEMRVRSSLPEGPDLYRAVYAWRLDEDPSRARLAQLYAALDLSGESIQDLPSLLGWMRYLFEEGRVSRGWPHQGLSEHVAAELERWARTPRRRELLSQATLDGRVVPALPLRPGPGWTGRPFDSAEAEVLARLEGREGPQVVGVAGPAAAGKTTLARALSQRAEILGCDGLTWMGHGFRYVQHQGWRDNRLVGPSIYDDSGIAAEIRAWRDGRSQGLLVVDGVYLGLDTQVRDQLDLLVVLLRDDADRLAAKLARDSAPEGRDIDIRSDFCQKVFQENRDGLQPLIDHQADLVLDVSAQRILTP